MMEAVDKRWYIGYTWWIVICSVIILAVRLAGLFVPLIGEHLQTWGISNMTVVLAALTLTYRFTLYNRHADKLGLNFATFIISLLQISNVINLINITGWIHSWYISVLYTMFFFSGIVGVFPVIGAVLLLSLFALISIPSISSGQSSVLEPTIILGIGYLVCFIDYLTWRGKYIDEESQRVSNLSSMLKSNQQQSEILIRSIADGVVVIDTEGTINLINPAVSAMTEWPVDEANDMDADKVIHLTKEDGKELTDEENPFVIVLKQRKQFSQNMQIVGRKDKKTIVSLVISPIVLPSTNEFVGAVAVLRDVSEARR
ncbi:MAG: PAS domain-containing protein, partial [Patescibacteria group bacterium]